MCDACNEGMNRFGQWFWHMVAKIIDKILKDKH